MGPIDNIIFIALLVIAAMFFIVSFMLLSAMQYRELKMMYWTSLKTIFKSKAFYKWILSTPACKHKELSYFNRCKNCGSHIKRKKK